MKYVSKNEFLKYPQGAVYVSEDFPYDIRIKESKCFGSLPIAINTEYNEHLSEDDDFVCDYFDDDMFYVYEKDDILALKKLINNLVKIFYEV